jgi:hypothetical protein
MIKPTNPYQTALPLNFTLCRNLSPNNRWVLLAQRIPWEELCRVYEESLSPDQGAPAIPSRVVIGALIIKHLKNLSDEETIEEIRENPYYQYFLGYGSFSDRQVFAPSLFVEIRKRLGVERLQRMNDLFLGFTPQEGQVGPEEQASEGREEHGDQPSDEPKPPLPPPAGKDDPAEVPKKGALILDATVAPQDITYPTDVGLVNECREKTEALIDALWVPGPGKVKPRTYRRKARQEYIAFSRQRNPRKKTIRKAWGRQLCYVRRNLRHIEALLDTYPVRPFPLPYKYQRQLWILREVYRQQEIMYRTRAHTIAHRIVSLSQPYVRPIVRGKAKAKTEFGAKLSGSVVDGKLFLDRLEWEAYNESQDLRSVVERYYRRFGYYPASVYADKLYWNRSNRRYLKSLGIKLYGGKPLGRPQNPPPPQERKRHQRDPGKRNHIEGKFGLGKRHFGLGLVMAKTKQTSESWIAMVILVVNIAREWREIIFSQFFSGLQALAGYFGLSSKPDAPRMRKKLYVIGKADSIGLMEINLTSA